MRYFLIELPEEFLAGGDVATEHTAQIPIWAGFLIEQVADLRQQIGFMSMTQAISLHAQFQGDMSAIEAAYNQLVTANTSAKVYSQQLLNQIATLQGQLADPAGDPVTSDDLTQLNTFAAQIQASAAATATTVPGATPPATTGTTVAAAPSTDGSAAPSTDGTAAAADPTSATTTTAPAASSTPAPTTAAAPGSSATAAASPAAASPVTIAAGDSGTSN